LTDAPHLAFSKPGLYPINQSIIIAAIKIANLLRQKYPCSN
jgi:hypothetical protein